MSVSTKLCVFAGVWLAGGLTHPVIAQSLHGASNDTTTRSVVPVPLVAASFSQPSRPHDVKFDHALGACQAVFERTLATLRYDRPHVVTPAHDTLFAAEADWTPLAPEAIATARACYGRLYASANEVPDIDVDLLWPLTIATNDDTLLQTLVSRRLAQLRSVNAKTVFLERVVTTLMNNVWTESGSTTPHLTNTHVVLARQYTAQLESLGPTALAAWLRARKWLESGMHLVESDSAIRVALADAEHALQVVRDVPPAALPDTDRYKVRGEVNSLVLRVRQLAYLATLSHEDLTRLVQTIDSQLGSKRPWLVGMPAPPLSADYWFGTPGGKSPAVPAQHQVSLVVFVSANPGSSNPSAAGAPEQDALLRRIHMRFPTLSIILMTRTYGKFANQSLVDRPDEEARLTNQYLRDSLQLPGILGVITSKYRTGAEGRAIPVQLPLLDQYMIDTRDLNGAMYLVDRDGWVVWQVAQEREIVPVIARLLK